jgi:hypothetical protein
MSDYSDLKPTGEKYEPPRAMRLSDAQMGRGASCHSGSTASDCNIGSRATNNCNLGLLAGNHCRTGTTGRA